MTATIDIAVGDIMNRWPETIRLFMRRRMNCIGCPLASFHTPDIACAEHEISLEAFLADLAEVIGAKV